MCLAADILMLLQYFVVIFFKLILFPWLSIVTYHNSTELYIIQNADRITLDIVLCLVELQVNYKSAKHYK